LLNFNPIVELKFNGNKIDLWSAACKQQLEQNPSKYGY